MGKTTVLRMAWERLQSMFPGGDVWAYATPTFNHELVLAELEARPGRTLLVIEEVGEFADEVIDYEGLRRAGAGIAVTTRDVSYLLGRDDVSRVRISSFGIREMDASLRQYAIYMDEEHLAATRKLLSGNPRLVREFAEALRAGLIEPQAAADLLGSFSADLQAQTAETSEGLVTAVSDELVKLLARQPQELYRLPPRKFEELVAHLLETEGYGVVLTKPSADGGRDILATMPSVLGPSLFYVECKRYAPDNPVGVEVVRQLYGVVQASRANAGAVVTSSFFTRGAKEFQQSLEHHLHLRDYFRVQEWLLKAIRR